MSLPRAGTPACALRIPGGLHESHRVHQCTSFQSTDFIDHLNPRSDGPSEDDLRHLAAGIIDPDKALVMTQHVAQCPHCAPILRAFTEDFSDDLTPDETKAESDIFAQLRSATPQWQKEMAAKALNANRSNLSAFASGQKLFGWPIRPFLAPAAIAAAALIAFGLWFTQRDTPEKVEKLLAQAYTEQRTMEYRWPGAEWGPVRVTRGSGQSPLSRPTSQLEAEKILAEHQASASKDPNWLTAKAEAELLDNQPQLAISDLTQSLSANPGSSNIELMLAIAYAQQGDKSDDRASREKALELLNRILNRIKIADPAARFNRALLYQRLNMPEKAKADWTALARHGVSGRDPSIAQWAKEAQQELENVR